jgi:hypothetical protein
MHASGARADWCSARTVRPRLASRAHCGGYPYCGGYGGYGGYYGGGYYNGCYPYATGCGYPAYSYRSYYYGW